MEVNKEETYIGKECFYIDKVTYENRYDGRPLGVCINETLHSVCHLPICWFEKPFLGFQWFYKSDINKTLTIQCHKFVQTVT